MSLRWPFEGLLHAALPIDLPLGRPIQVAGVVAALVIAHGRIGGTLPAVALQVEHRRPAGVVIGQAAVDVAVGIDVEIAHAGRAQHVAGELKRHEMSSGKVTPARQCTHREGRRPEQRIGGSKSRRESHPYAMKVNGRARCEPI